MKCKYCQAELHSNSSVCPECGKDNLQPGKDPLLVMKIITLSLTCVVMLVLLAGMVLYGVTGSFLPNWGANATNPSTGAATTAPAEKTYTVTTADGKVTMDNATMQAAMNEVVATMGEHELTNRQLQLYYWMAVSTYAADADLTKDLDTQIYDKETGKTYQDYCVEMALNAWQETTLLADAAREAEFELPQANKDELEAMESQLEQYVYMYSMYGYDISTVDELVQMQFGAGCNYATYYNYCAEYYLGGLYWGEMVLDLDVTAEQIEQYFTEHAEELKKDYGIDKESGNVVDYRNILILVGSTEVTAEDGTTSTTVTDEDWAECLAEAQALYDGWLAAGGTEEAFIALVAEHSEDTTSATYDGLYENQAPGSLAQVDVRHILIFPEGATSSTVTSQEWSDEAWAYAENKAQEILNTYLAGELTEEAFGELAKEHSADGSASAGGLYEDVYVGQMVQNFEDWCFDSIRKSGDTGIVKTEYGYHVMYFVRSDNEGDTWMFGQEHQPGDSVLVKNDNGYELLYFVESAPEWYRYSLYGVQNEMGEEMLAKLVEENPYTVDHSKIALTTAG